jgi:hypothetical protein
VERLLRSRFENDDALHAPQRREAEKVREQLLVAKSETRNPKSEIQTEEVGGASNLVALLKKAGVGQVTETTWQLGARTAAPNAPAADEMEIKKRFGPDATILSAPGSAGRETKQFFGDLPGELQRVLRAQLRQAGDVSAVIETPGGFLLYVCKEKTAATLSVATLSLPKRSYEEWLAEQGGGTR